MAGTSTFKGQMTALFLTIFIDLLRFGIIIPILHTNAKALGASPLFIGVIAASFSFTQFLFAPIWGSTSDRLGRRPIILVSILATALAYVFFANANTLFLLLISRILSGLGSANISAAQAYVSDITTAENRTKSMGMIGAAFGLGFIFGPPIGGFIKEHFGVEYVGYFTAALCLLNFILAYFLLPESLIEKRASKRSLKQTFTAMGHAFKKPVVSDLFWINFIFIAAFSMMQVNCTLLWSEDYGLSEKQVGYVFGFIGICSAIVQGGLIGRMNKKLGEQKLLTYGNYLMAIGLAGLPFVPKTMFIPFELFFLLIIALANGCIIPSINSLLSFNTPRNEQGQILGSLQSVGSLARGIGHIIGGFIYGMGHALPFIVGGVLMLFSAYLTKLLFRIVGKQTPTG